MYSSGDLDLSLGTDELTGNRYLFAAANPVDYYADGHRPGWCKTFWNCKKQNKKEGEPLPQAEPATPVTPPTSVGPADRGKPGGSTENRMCREMDKPTVKWRLDRTACPPFFFKENFGYEPQLVQMPAGPRYINSNGDECSHVPSSGEDFDFLYSC